MAPEVIRMENRRTTATLIILSIMISKKCMKSKLRYLESGGDCVQHVGGPVASENIR